MSRLAPTLATALALGAGAAALAGCGNGPTSPTECTLDTDCSGGDVCAHTHECWPADQVRAVTIHWTIAGAAPTATSCAGILQLEVGYAQAQDPNSLVLFSPVACTEGAFPNDKWPITYDTAVIYADSSSGSTHQSAPIPAGSPADVTIDVAHP